MMYHLFYVCVCVCDIAYPPLPSDRNVDAAGMNEEELALRMMSKIRALKVANILHLNVKKVSRIEKKNKQTSIAMAIEFNITHTPTPHIHSFIQY